MFRDEVPTKGITPTKKKNMEKGETMKILSHTIMGSIYKLRPRGCTLLLQHTGVAHIWSTCDELETSMQMSQCGFTEMKIRWT